jgi:hypothetical protein
MSKQKQTPKIRKFSYMSKTVNLELQEIILERSRRVQPLLKLFFHVFNAPDPKAKATELAKKLDNPFDDITIDDNKIINWTTDVCDTLKEIGIPCP